MSGSAMLSRVGVASDRRRAPTALPEKFRAPLGTPASEAADLSPARGSGSAFVTIVMPTKRAAPRTICLAGLGMSYLWLPRGCQWLTQRDLDRTIACHDQRSIICRWPMRGHHSLCDAFRCEDSNYRNIPPDAGVVCDPLHT